MLSDTKHINSKYSRVGLSSNSSRLIAECQFFDKYSNVSTSSTPKNKRQIANFLDRKTGQIDELIRIKERRIELLQEQRTVLINQAVTKGLDPNVEMKPSGMEWIGEIPKHWEVIKIQNISQ